MSDQEDIQVELKSTEDINKSKNITLSPGGDGEEDEEIYAQGSQGRQNEQSAENKKEIAIPSL